MALVSAAVRPAIDEAEGRMGPFDEDGLLDLGAYVLENDARWIAKWRDRIDAEVDRRAAVDGVGEAGRRLLRLHPFRDVLDLASRPR
jgi:hypothetical protein